MADENIVNGVASDVDDRTDENDIILKDGDLNREKDAKISELTEKIDDLEQVNSGLSRENEENREKIKLLHDEIERFKRNQTEMDDRLEKMQKEIDQSEEDKKSLQAVTDRAVVLERDVSLLQHDLISTMSANEETEAEFRKLKSEFEELKKSDNYKQSKIEDLEKEKISLLEQVNKEIEEVKILKAKNDNHILDLESREVQISERNNEILGLQTSRNEKEAQKSSLQEALNQSDEKFKNMEAEIERLKFELEKSEKEIRKSQEIFDTKILSPAVIASTGTVLGAAAVACYFIYSKGK